MDINIGWTSPAWCSYAWQWWAACSWGSGEHARHFTVRLLGFYLEWRELKGESR
jgi:hypothetical protein